MKTYDFQLGTVARGFAMLESASFLTVLLSFILGGVGIAGYLGAVGEVSSAVNEAAADDAAKPFLLEISDSGLISLRLDEPALHAYLEHVVSELSRRLGGTDAASAAEGDHRFKVEAAFEVIDIDSNTGGFARIEDTTFEESERGTLDTSFLKCPELSAYIRDAASRTNAQKSAFALPTGLLSGAQTGHQYFDRSVLVGIRAARDLSSSSGAGLYQILGGRAVAESCKLVELRGEVGQ